MFNEDIVFCVGSVLKLIIVYILFVEVGMECMYDFVMRWVFEIVCVVKKNKGDFVCRV